MASTFLLICYVVGRCHKNWLGKRDLKSTNILGNLLEHNNITLYDNLHMECSET